MSYIYTFEIFEFKVLNRDHKSDVNQEQREINPML
jgi:hypothetical protein